MSYSGGNYVYQGQGMQSTYGAIPIGGLTINPTNKMNLPGITFKITPANGGTIITVTEDVREKNQITLSGYEREELYIIPDDVEDFDKELGKIITMQRMKQQHE
jgi:hypothetical protein